MKNNKLLLLLLFLGGSSFGMAQSFDRSVLSSDGATSTTGTLTLDWTLGELAVSTVSTQGGLLTQGFHQPGLTVSVVSVANKLEDYYQVQARPNPVSSLLTVDVTSTLEETLMIDLLDLNGKLLKREKLIFPFAPVLFEMGIYPSGLYIVRVATEQNQPVKLFKINKND